MHAFQADEWISEVGGGTDLRRRKFLKLMDAVDRGKIPTLVIAHEDRLARFGSPRAEMVADLLSVVHTSSCRLCGLRRYEKALQDDLGDGTS